MGNFNGGCELRQLRDVQRSRFRVPTMLSGNVYASALLGDFTSLSQSSSRPIGFFRYTNLEFYVQDTWKVMPRLTLDYGMRFAWFQPQDQARDQAVDLRSGQLRLGQGRATLYACRRRRRLRSGASRNDCRREFGADCRPW